MLKLVPLSAMYATVSGGLRTASASEVNAVPVVGHNTGSGGLGTARVAVANGASDECSDAGDTVGSVGAAEEHDSAEEGACSGVGASAGSYLAVVGPDLDGSPQGDR
jgi:hypothetical protein